MRKRLGRATENGGQQFHCSILPVQECKISSHQFDKLGLCLRYGGDKIVRDEDI